MSRSWMVLVSGLLLVGALLASPAQAQQRYRVDDTGTRVLTGGIKMEWDRPSPVMGEAPTVTGVTPVYVRMNVKPWRGRSGRIFLTLPPQPFGELQVSWQARQRLLAGAFVSGDRGGLVYAGPIDSDVLEDTLLLTVKADGTRLERTEQLEFSFFIELD